MTRRVLFTDYYDFVGGGQQNLLSVFKALDRKRWQPLLAVPREGAFADAARALNVPVFVTPMGKARWRLPWQAYPAMRRLRRLMREQAADLVHSNDYPSHKLAAVAARGQQGQPAGLAGDAADALQLVGGAEEGHAVAPLHQAAGQVGPVPGRPFLGRPIGRRGAEPHQQPRAQAVLAEEAGALLDPGRWRGQFGRAGRRVRRGPAGPGQGQVFVHHMVLAQPWRQAVTPAQQP